MRTLGASAATRQSHASAISQPPPSAAPLMAATVVAGSAARSSSAAWMERMASSSAARSSGVARSTKSKSAPATKLFCFALRTTTAPVPDSRAWRTASANARIIAGLMALMRSSGRSMTMWPTPSLWWKLTLNAGSSPRRLTPSEASRDALEDDGAAVPARRADAHQAVAGAAAMHLQSERGDHARAGRAERMAERDRATHHVHALLVQPADAVRLQHLEGGEDLRGERLVHLDQVDVLQPQSRPLECDRDGVRGRDEELIGGIDRGVGVGADGRERLVSQGPSALLGHEDAGRR